MKSLTWSSWLCFPTRRPGAGHPDDRLDFPGPGALPATRSCRRTPGGIRYRAAAMAFDHGPMVAYARARLVAKMSYTNIGFALAPKPNSRCRRYVTFTAQRWDTGRHH